VHETSIDGTAINVELVCNNDGLPYDESIDLLNEGIYLHLQLNIFLHLIDASFLLDASSFITIA